MATEAESELVERRRISALEYERKGADGAQVFMHGAREFRQVTIAAGEGGGALPLLRSLGRSLRTRLRPDVRLWLPPLVWLRTYTRRMAVADVAAGITHGTFRVSVRVSYGDARIGRRCACDLGHTLYLYVYLRHLGTATDAAAPLISAARSRWKQPV